MRLDLGFDSTPMTGFHGASTGSYHLPATVSAIIHHNDAVESITKMDQSGASQDGQRQKLEEVSGFFPAATFAKRGTRVPRNLWHIEMQNNLRGEPGRWSNRYLHSDLNDVTFTKKEGSRWWDLHKAGPRWSRAALPSVSRAWRCVLLSLREKLFQAHRSLHVIFANAINEPLSMDYIIEYERHSLWQRIFKES